MDDVEANNENFLNMLKDFQRREFEALSRKYLDDIAKNQVSLCF